MQDSKFNHNTHTCALARTPAHTHRHTHKERQTETERQSQRELEDKYLLGFKVAVYGSPP